MLKFNAILFGEKLEFISNPGLFSPKGVDSGTYAMLSCVQALKDDRILDLGCGLGVVGIYLAKAYGLSALLSDKDPEAIEIARLNAELNGLKENVINNDIRFAISDGFDNIDETGFTKILLNPPYHADFSVSKKLIEKSFNRLAVNGCMYVVAKRRVWYENKLRSLFGGVKVINKNGYYVFYAERRNLRYASRNKLKPVQRRQVNVSAVGP